MPYIYGRFLFIQWIRALRHLIAIVFVVEAINLVAKTNDWCANSIHCAAIKTIYGDIKGNIHPTQKECVYTMIQAFYISKINRFIWNLCSRPIDNAHMWWDIDDMSIRCFAGEGGFSKSMLYFISDANIDFDLFFLGCVYACASGFSFRIRITSTHLVMHTAITFNNIIRLPTIYNNITYRV